MATPVGQNQYGDDIYNTPNGNKTGTQITQELAAANWDGRGDPVSVYNATAAGSSGTSSTPGTTSTTSTNQTYPGVSSTDLAAIQAGLTASSGLSIKELNEKIREFDANLDWQKQMWQQQGLPDLAIRQRAQDLAEKSEADQAAQAQAQLAWTQKIGQQQQDLAVKTQADANAMAQSQLGLDTLKTAATLTGPADWIKATNYARGVQQSNLPGFITQLLTGGDTRTLGGPAPGAQMSDPNSMLGLAGQLGANTGTAGAAGGGAAAPAAAGAGTAGSAGGAGTQSNADYAAQRLRSLFAAGGQALAPQQLEGLTSTEMSMLTGGGADLGADVNGFLDQYKRSRIGQQTAQPATMSV